MTRSSRPSLALHLLLRLYLPFYISHLHKNKLKLLFLIITFSTFLIYFLAVRTAEAFCHFKLPFVEIKPGLNHKVYSCTNYIFCPWKKKKTTTQFFYSRRDFAQFNVAPNAFKYLKVLQAIGKQSQIIILLLFFLFYKASC